MGLVVTLIPLFPLAAAILTAIFGPRVLREKSHWPAILGCAGACVCSLIALTAVATKAALPQTFTLFTWARVPAVAGNLALDIPIDLRLDSLSATMLSMVTFVSTLVAIYASGYMHGERGYWRFFTEVSLFVFSMTMLVLSANFIQLYMFWEAVGLCSYLLVGFWYEKPSASAAGMKAFVVNRVGDFGFATGVFLIWTTFGTISFDKILFGPEIPSAGLYNPHIVEVICLCLFMGAVGKSAQFPLHVWLPDAMEGPTPVSALIHAATMVTAGVYMITRCTPLFMHAPRAQLTVAFIGGLTACMAAIIALTQTDLKRVLAYSTVSQLGYMFLGLGTGTYLGIAGGMFHLVTHAFFKALLFLAAGSVMHAMGGVIDMRRFSGLKRVMPTTYWTFLVGALALAGVAPLSGFWSKDTILAAAHSAGNPAAHHAAADAAGDGAHADARGDEHTQAEHAASVPAASEAAVPTTLAGLKASTWYLVLYWIGTFTAFLTAFYTFRAFFMTFHGETRIPEEAGHHAHESPPAMCVPLMILSAGAAFLGMLLGDLTGLFDAFLGRTIPGVAAGHHGMNLVVAGTSTVVALAGVGLAWIMYAKPSPLPAKVAAAFGPLTRLSEEKFYIDQVYDHFIVLPLRGLAQFCRFLDWILVDGMFVGLFTRLPGDLGQLIRPMQNGLVQFYALSMVLAMAVLMWALLAGQG